MVSAMLLLNTLPVFAQTSGTTDIIPTGGKWIPIFGNQPLDSLQAACEFDFNIAYKNRKPEPACRIMRLSSKKLYESYDVNVGDYVGFGHCFVESPKVKYELINNQIVGICSGSIEEPRPMSFAQHILPTCPTSANGQRAAADCECPVKPLKLITDPDTLKFENGDTLREDKLAPSMKTKLACLRAAVTKAGGILTVNSAWRPIGYQEHFYEIFSKFNELNKPENKKTQACKPIRDKIVYEKDTKHRIQGAVAKPSESRHEKGLAFDANWSNISDAKIDALLPACNLTRPFKTTDRIHFQ
ncbi:MAG: hypothetical protein RI956_1028 [Pseudomonadota bacterium]|jgi:LAS superfamily LD-carboxypeptidase LdcB